MSTKRELEPIRALISEHRYPEALDALHKMEADNGPSPETEFGKGICLAALGRITEARAVVRHLKELGQIALAHQVAEQIEQTDPLGIEKTKPAAPAMQVTPNGARANSPFYRNAFFAVAAIAVLLACALWIMRTRPHEGMNEQASPAPPAPSAKPASPAPAVSEAAESSRNDAPAQTDTHGRPHGEADPKERLATATLSYGRTPADSKNFYTATIRIVDTDKQPIVDAAIGPWISRAGIPPMRYGGHFTDSEGRFTFTEFPAGVVCGFNTDHLNGYTSVDTEGFVGNGGDELPEMTVVVEKLKGDVKGVALDTRGQWMSDQQLLVEVFYDDGKKAVLLGQTSPTGRFKFTAGRPNHKLQLAIRANGKPYHNYRWNSDVLLLEPDATMDLGDLAFFPSNS
ncbi:MAG: tetratricopeptide repeat protein [Candidatus Hydrogenedentes bacterium]|nr:tetratricopeptide repeat protein [Candidatus Hydrogenedentota bacterium]